MTAKLSVCLIVKDEVDILPQCLASLAGLVDEIVAVDTGSTDGTQALLRQAGATVYEYPWDNDFGAARTYALRQATGDWVLILDADEALDEATRQNLRALCIDLESPVSYEMAIRSYTTDDADDRATTLSWMPRMFNRPQSHMFLGRIHEQLVGSIPVRLDKSVLLIKHWGYQPQRWAAKGKGERNDSLLKTDEQLSGETVTNQVYLAMTALDGPTLVKHASKALEFYRQGIGTRQVPAIASAKLIEGHVKSGNLAQALQDIESLTAEWPIIEDEGLFWHAAGKAFQAAGVVDKAEAALRKAVDLLNGDPTLQAYWSESMPSVSTMALAECVLMQGRRPEAIVLLDQARQFGGIKRELRAHIEANLARLHAEAGDAIEALSEGFSAVDNNPAVRSHLANKFLDQGMFAQALQLMAPILSPEQLRDRTLTVAAGLLGDPQAIDLTKWYLANVADDPDVRKNLAFHLLAVAQPDEARTAMAAAYNRAEGDAEVELHLAFFEQQLGHHEPAEARLVAVVVAASENGQDGWLHQALTQWGNLAFHRQEWPKAADLFRQALELRPQDAYLHFALGSALCALGELEEARQRFERTLILEPGHLQAIEGLNTLAQATNG